MAIDVEKASRRLDDVVEAFRGKERFLVQTHNNPDPDSMACAMAIRFLVQRYTGRDAVIAFGGIVGRSENRAMVRQLSIPLVPGALVDYDSYDFTAVCDTQPGTNYTSFPEGFVPTVVIDHHPCRDDTLKSDVVIVEPGYGATATLVAEMLLAKGIPIPKDVATALYYGIKSETQDLCRETTDVDQEVYSELAKLADRRLVSQIESEKVPREYYGELQMAISRATVHGEAVWTDLGSVRAPDMVAEMADFLLRLEGSCWSAVMGLYQDTLYMSLRTDDEEADAGEVLQSMVVGIGYGGGHLSMAGGQVPMKDFTADERKATKDRLRKSFLDRVGIDDLDGGPLLPPKNDDED